MLLPETPAEHPEDPKEVLLRACGQIQLAVGCLQREDLTEREISEMFACIRELRAFLRLAAERT